MSTRIYNKGHSTGTIILAIIAVAAIVWIISTSNTPKSAFPIPTNNLQNPTLSCTALTYKPTASATLYWNDFTKPTASAAYTPTQVATTYSYYVPSVSTAASVLTGTSSASAGVNYTVACGTALWLVGGDQATYLQNLTTATVLNGTQYMKQTLYKVGTPTALVANTPQATGTTTARVSVSAAAAGTQYTFYESIQSDNNYIGNTQGFVVIYNYNSLAFSTPPTISGATRYYGQLPSPTGGYISGQSAQIAYQFPQCHYNQYCFPNGVSSGFGTFTVLVQTSSTYGANTPIGQQIVPLTSYLDGTGTWQYNKLTNLQGTVLVSQTVQASFITVNNLQ